MARLRNRPLIHDQSGIREARYEMKFPPVKKTDQSENCETAPLHRVIFSLFLFCPCPLGDIHDNYLYENVFAHGAPMTTRGYDTITISATSTTATHPTIPQQQHHQAAFSTTRVCNLAQTCSHVWSQRRSQERQGEIRVSRCELIVVRVSLGDSRRCCSPAFPRLTCAPGLKVSLPFWLDAEVCWWYTPHVYPASTVEQAGALGARKPNSQCSF